MENKKSTKSPFVFITIIATIVVGFFIGLFNMMSAYDKKLDEEASYAISHGYKPSGNSSSFQINMSSPSPSPTLSDVERGTEYLRAHVGAVALYGLNQEQHACWVIFNNDQVRGQMHSVLNGNPQSLEWWSGLVNNYKKMSIEFYAICPGYSISILNPFNTDKILLTVMNGNVSYNFAD